MFISNNYSLQRKMELKKGLFDKLHDVSLVLKILFLLSILALIWSLWFAFLSGFLLIADVILAVYRSKLIFTYVYRYTDGLFSITKIGLDGKETTLEKINVKDIVSVSFSDETGGNRYFSDQDEFGEDKPVKICTEKNCFFILSDLYLYSILCYASGENK